MENDNTNPRVGGGYAVGDKGPVFRGLLPGVSVSVSEHVKMPARMRGMNRGGLNFAVICVTYTHQLPRRPFPFCSIDFSRLVSSFIMFSGVDRLALLNYWFLHRPEVCTVTRSIATFET